MKAEHFDEQNLLIGDGQPQYFPLPAHVFKDDPQGRTVFCWSFSWRERLCILFGMPLWHEVLTFRSPLQPQRLSLEKPQEMKPIC